MPGIIRLAAFAAIVAVTPCFAESAEAGEAPLSMTPFKLILNAQGQFEDVEGNFGVGLPPGTIDAFAFDLYLDGILVSEAYAVRYCFIDNVLSVSFDREALQANPDVVAMAGLIVEAQVKGSVVVDDGAVATEVDLVGTDEMEILRPGLAGPLR